jgi:hypothetical protein
MTNQQKIKELQSQIDALKTQELQQIFNWEEAPVICELNGYRWQLGPEADDELNWQDARDWCQSVGGELPPREVLLMAYTNEETRPLFKAGCWYWSSTEFSATYAWTQTFSNGNQLQYTKTATNYVKAVRKVLI